MNSKKQLTTTLAIIVPVLLLSFCAWNTPPSSPKQVGLFHNLKIGELVLLRETSDRSHFYITTFADIKTTADGKILSRSGIALDADVIKEVEKDFIVVYDNDRNQDILIPATAIQSIRLMLKDKPRK